MANLFDNPEMAEGYATARPPVHPLIIERIAEHLNVNEPLPWGLDVGCGAGLSTGALQRISAQCIGIEPSETMLKWSPHVAPDCQFVAGRAEVLPLASESVDVITAAGSLNFAELDLFFPEASRVLRPSGFLIVYDFSEGRSFRDSNLLDLWYAEFLRRYPRPVDSGRALDPEILAGLASGFELHAREQFAAGLPLTRQQYLKYVLTETNVADAIANGNARDVIEAWCSESLKRVFDDASPDVIFRGYIAYFRPLRPAR